MMRVNISPMHAGKGQVVELILRGGLRHAHISCRSNLVPAPGQYLLASDGSRSPLPDPVFYTDLAPSGFLASPVPESWMPGLEIHLRGPLGRGFVMPSAARKVALVPFAGSSTRLRPLIPPALNQGAAVVWVTDMTVDDLPDEVEVHPFSALEEISAWADWTAFDVDRVGLAGLRDGHEKNHLLLARSEAQVLIQTPLPCGGIAECGACAVLVKSGWKLACKDGPVFRGDEI